MTGGVQQGHWIGFPFRQGISGNDYTEVIQQAKFFQDRFRKLCAFVGDAAEVDAFYFQIVDAFLEAPITMTVYAGIFPIDLKEDGQGLLEQGSSRPCAWSADKGAAD